MSTGHSAEVRNLTTHCCFSLLAVIISGDAEHTVWLLDEPLQMCDLKQHVSAPNPYPISHNFTGYSKPKVTGRSKRPIISS